jgi:hypothetical protein
MKHDLNRDRALALARAGIAVFPCGPDKKPLVKWRNVASRDVRVIADLWSAHPGALPGIDLGKADLVVLDGDRHGGPDGRLALRQLLLSQNGFDGRAAPTVFTPGNGVHVYFRQNGRSLSNTRGNLPEGIDVRGAGGFAIGPDAALPDGRCYRPAPGAADLISAYQAGTIPQVPPGIVALITANKLKTSQHVANDPGIRERTYARAALDGCVEELAAAAPGSRNEMLNKIAYHVGRMVVRGWIARGQVEAALIGAMHRNNYVAEKGVNAVVATLKSGLDAGENEPHDNLADQAKPASKQVADENVRRGGGSHNRSQADILIELAQTPNCFTPLTARASPIWPLMATAKRGRSGRRISGIGWRAAFLK